MEDQSGVDSFINKYKLPLGMGLVGVVLLIGGIVSSGIIPKTFVKSTKSSAAATSNYSKQETGTKVDVSGAVAKPGVYTLNGNSRVEDALKAAGGVTESADPVYLSKTINLAQKVSDGMKIYIPRVNEAGPSAAVAGASVVPGKLVDVNTATLDDLDKLPGVGPTTAQKIIDNRPYGGIEELLTKKAVSRTVYEKIKEQISTW